MQPEIQPTLSVVFAATHDSPTLRTALQRHREALADVGGELLIADGSPDGLTPDVPTVIHMPGADVFALRAAAVKLARAPIVAFTEDHCLPVAGWHEAILRAHAEHENVVAVGGAVLNGSTEHVIDWANFLMTFGPFLPPLPPRNLGRPSPAANLSFKRELLAEYEFTPGQLELEILPHLNRIGQLVLDDRIRIEHVQSHGHLSTVGHHFHNGRTTASLPRRSPPVRERIVRAAHTLILPFLLVSHVLGEMRRKTGFRRSALRATPFIMLLAFAHATGEMVGLFFGPGTSPERLE
ncbi:MAG: glycosyltransferase family 2 protein [Thermoleophilia bacterium]|nr:glycosyltransferase family 2 protein [Thermoleophilia bacterium]